MRRKNLTRLERQIQIQQWFAGNIQEYNDNTPKSLAQIAQGIGLSPSPYLRSICETLVDDHILVASKLTRSGRWDGRGYRLKKRARSRPATRNVVINFVMNGQRVHEEYLL